MNIFGKAVRNSLFVQTVGLPHLSLYSIAVGSFLEVAFGNGEQNLILTDFSRREIKKFKRKIVIMLPPIEQRFDQFLAGEAFAFRESFPHKRWRVNLAKKAVECKVCGGKRESYTGGL